MSYPDPRIWIPFETQYLDEFTTDGVELINDYDMAAVGVASYTSGNSAALSKVSNGEGGQALRVLYNGVSTPYATQATLASNEYYIADVRARGDGVVNGDARTEGGTVDWYPRISTGWQTAKWEHLGGSGLLRAGSRANGAGRYTDYDYFSVQRTKKRHLDASGNGHHLLRGDGYTGTFLPATLLGKGMGITATQEFGKIVDPLKATSQFSVSMLVKHPANAGTIEFCQAWDGTDRFFMFQMLGGTSIRCYVGGASSANAAIATVPDVLTHRAKMHVGATHDGVNTHIYINGALAGTAATPLAPTYSNQNIWFGRRYDGSRNWLGEFYDFKVWVDGYLTNAQISEVYHDDLQRYSRLSR